MTSVYTAAEEFSFTALGIQQYLQGTVRIKGQRVWRMSNGGMQMAVITQGLERGTTTERTTALDENGVGLVGFGELPYADLNRPAVSGGGYSTMSTAAVAGLVVRPGTTAAFEIFNPYAVGGKCLVIDRIFAFNLVSAQVAQAYNQWAMVTTSKAAPTSGSFAVRGNYGQAASSVIAAAGTTVVDKGWFPWGFPVSPKPVEATVTPFGGSEARIEGRLIVPPQCSLCLHVVSQTTASTFTQGASWFEMVIKGISP